MEAKANMRMSVHKTINVIFTKNSEPPDRECKYARRSVNTRNETTLCPEDCVYVLEVAKKTNRIEEIKNSFVKTTQDLFLGLSHDTLTEKEKMTIVNFLCERGVLHMNVTSELVTTNEHQAYKNITSETLSTNEDVGYMDMTSEPFSTNEDQAYKEKDCRFVNSQTYKTDRLSLHENIDIPDHVTPKMPSANEKSFNIKENRHLVDTANENHLYIEKNKNSSNRTLEGTEARKSKRKQTYSAHMESEKQTITKPELIVYHNCETFSIVPSSSGLTTDSHIQHDSLSPQEGAIQHGGIIPESAIQHSSLSTQEGAIQHGVLSPESAIQHGSLSTQEGAIQHGVLSPESAIQHSSLSTQEGAIQHGGLPSESAIQHGDLSTQEGAIQHGELPIPGLDSVEMDNTEHQQMYTAVKTKTNTNEQKEMKKTIKSENNVSNFSDTSYVCEPENMNRFDTTVGIDNDSNVSFVESVSFPTHNRERCEETLLANREQHQGEMIVKQEKESLDESCSSRTTSTDYHDNLSLTVNEQSDQFHRTSMNISYNPADPISQPGSFQLPSELDDIAAADQRGFVCDVCDKWFRYHSRLIVHMKVHLPGVRYPCQVCHKTFATKGNLNIHQSIHTGLRPYQCSVCKKGFRTRDKLNIHTRIHTGEKPHKCQYCGKRFNDKSNYNTHVRIHTGVNVFSCALCGVVYSRRAQLIKHMKKHSL